MNISDKSPLHDLAGMLAGLQDPSAPGKTGPSKDPSVQNRAGDQVRISDRAREFQQLALSVAQVPDIRADKVAKLRDAIGAGTYNVRGDQVADKVIRQTILDAIL